MDIANFAGAVSQLSIGKDLILFTNVVLLNIFLTRLNTFVNKL